MSNASRGRLRNLTALQAIRRTWVAGVAIVVLFAAAAPTSGAVSPPVMRSIRASDFTLAYSETSAGALAALDARTRPATFGAVLDGAPWPLTTSCPERAVALPKSVRAQRTICWGDSENGVAGDVSTSPWVPQGIAVSGEANISGSVQNHRAIIASWTRNTDNVPASETDTPAFGHNDMRLAFVNYDDENAPRFRWVLPVQVGQGGSGLTMTPTPGHGGGLAWYANFVFMTDTNGGIRVFDINRIRAVETGTNVGCSATSCTAGKHTYVMPQVAYYRDNTSLTFDSLALDRSSTPDSLVAGEYRQASDSLTTRVVRFPFTADYRLTGTASEAWQAMDVGGADTVKNLQGAQINDGRLLMGRSDDPTAGRLFRVGPDLADTPQDCPPENGVRPHFCWATGVEDMSLWYYPSQQDPSNANTGELWTHTEKEGRRVMFSVALADIS
ncbi:hypothetical protein [Embleya hyalina]|uniref:Secreted protein n=1 Tax=Embleya hyalina TaxID=516124 RepID=A0A401YMY6_9ACTN|nr:hypothetical protein [Embleya hyalina]GCD95984.1 hypothetical protein EHYA_03668 [Embleya hyalina]